MPHVWENRGRPTKICPEAREKILTAIKSNLPYKHAAWAAKIHPSTLYRWLEQGEKDQADNLVTEYSLFCDSIKEVEAERIADHFDVMSNCVERWQARAWILERRWPKEFGQNVLERENADRLDKLEANQNKEIKDANAESSAK